MFGALKIVKNENSPRVICGFPGVGKSSLYNKLKEENFSIVDSDSSQFDKSKFPQNYIEHIQQKLNEGYWVLCSTHSVVRKALKEAGILYYLAIPTYDQKEEYMERYKNRGSPEAFLKLMDNKWDDFIKDVEDDDCKYKYFLFSGRYLDSMMNIIIPPLSTIELNG